MEKNTFTDERIVRAMEIIATNDNMHTFEGIQIRVLCRDTLDLITRQRAEIAMHRQHDHEVGDKLDVILKKMELVKDAFDAVVAERDKAVENYKAALLKKIFPYDAVDKKQYSINAYAVWQAINETEVHHD